MSQKPKKSNHSQHQAQVLRAPNGFLAQLKSHQGPLPDPETLGKYEAIVPGFAERIMNMAETEQRQRHERNKELIQNQHKQHKRDTDTFRWGQFYAILAVAAVVSLCYYMVSKDCPTAAASIGVAAIVGVAVAFHNKKPDKPKKEKETSEKDEQ